MAKRMTNEEKRRQLIKTYLLLLLEEKKRTNGQTLEQIVEQMEQDAKGWSEEDKKALREQAIWKMHPVKSGVIQ